MQKLAQRLNFHERTISTWARQPDPTKALLTLLQGCIEATGAVAGCFYRLRLNQSALVPEVHIGFEQAPLALPLRDLPKRASDAKSPLELAVLGRQPVTESARCNDVCAQPALTAASSVLAVPIIRESNCMGAIVLESRHRSSFGEESISLVQTLAAMALVTFEKQSTLNLLKELQQPLDFAKRMDEFLEEVLFLVSEASGMPYIALREPDGEGGLRCVALWGFGKDVQKANWDLADLNEYPAFKQAFEGRTVPEPTMDAPHLQNLRGRPELDLVQSFAATPVKVGGGIFGVLSFACECPYVYSELELIGFESIANGIGVSITNYRNFERAEESAANYGQLAISITGLEIAQATRHEAKAHVDDSNSLLLLIRNYAKTPSKENSARITEKAREIEQKLSDVSVALDRIRDATKPPRKELRRSSILLLWREAFRQVGARLNELGIRYRFVGADTELDVYPEFLRHAFLNLILNSIDAFRERGKKRGREIVVTLDSQSEDSQFAKIRYVDNASGIDISNLSIPNEADKGLPLGEVVFKQRVTSKEGGSGGYGLFLVRKIMADHHGSINLVDYRNGVVFDMLLPKKVQLQHGGPGGK